MSRTNSMYPTCILPKKNLFLQILFKLDVLVYGLNHEMFYLQNLPFRSQALYPIELQALSDLLSKKIAYLKRLSG